MDAMIDVRSPAWCCEADRLVGELSSALIRPSDDGLATALDTAMRRIAESLDVDRSTLLESAGAGESFEIVYEWARPSAAPVDFGPPDAAAALEAPRPRDAAPVKWLADCLQMDSAPVVLARIPDDLPPHVRTPDAIDYLHRSSLKSAAVIPIVVAGQRACVLGVGADHTCTWSEPVVQRLQLVGEILAAALHRRRQDQALRETRAEIARLEARLEGGAGPLEDELLPPLRFGEIVGEAPPLRAALGRLAEVASTDSTVLLLGETGTGKELFARALHERSERRRHPLINVNCAALPPTLIESELFGHERGAFTGAVALRQGRFELAHRGTIFLDEIGDLPLDLQAKLLRVVQHGEFERLGSSTPRKVDVRIVAATHRDLDRAVAEGRFRDDLFYRLSVFPIRVPPLRERRLDIQALVWSFIHKRQRAMNRRIKRVPLEVMDMLERYSWPGNVRELENVIERALIHSTGDTLMLLDVPLEHEVFASSPSIEERTLSAVNRTHIEGVLSECGWRINGPGNAAERLGLHPNTLRFRMKKLGIVRQLPIAGSSRSDPALARLR
jgi:transcriptional regulator with GAF, ATPase, and Fis domain